MLRAERPAKRSCRMKSSRPSSSMEPSLPPFKCSDCSTKHLGNHVLRHHQFDNEPSVIDRAPMPRLLRYRRQQARRATEPTTQVRSTGHYGRDLPRPVAEPMANTTGELASDDVQVRA